MSAPLPHRYEVRVSWTGGAEGRVAAEALPELAVAPPPEWDGPGGRWSPEHLLLASAASCFMTTFLAVAARSKLAPSAFRAEAAGTLDKTGDGLAFTSVRISVDLAVPAGEEERAARLLELAKKRCIVSNSLRCPVVLEPRVGAG